MQGNHRTNETKKTQDETDVNEQIDTDYVLARKIQKALIPHKFPFKEGVEISSFFQQCESIGGDLFDVVHISDDKLAFVLFNVAGHGVSVTLISSIANHYFTLALRSFQSPRTVIERVNAEFIHNVKIRCSLTAFVGILDFRSNYFSFSNAGHIDPLLYQNETGTLMPLSTRGLPIGIAHSDTHFEEQGVFLNPSDRLLLFSEGVYNLFCDTDCVKGKYSFESEISDLFKSATPGTITEWVHKKCSSNSIKHLNDDVTLVYVEILSDAFRNQTIELLGFKKDDPVYLQYISYFEEIDKAIAQILSLMDNFGYADVSIRKMKIVLTELMINAIEHGNKRNYTKKVIVGHVVDKKKSVVSIMDEGLGFDRSTIANPTSPENIIKDSGRGLFIVRYYVDEITYNDVGNRVTVIKKA